MTDTITIDRAAAPPITINNSNTITLNVDSNGAPYYSDATGNHAVALLTAELSAASLVVTAVPQSGVTKPTVRFVTGERGGSYDVTGGIGWSYNGNDLVITCTTPGTSNHAIDWQLTDASAPPLKLKIRIIRQ